MSTNVNDFSQLFGGNGGGCDGSGGSGLTSQSSSSQSQIIFEKNSLICPSDEQTIHLLNYLLNKINENNGETIYYVGVSENGENGLTEEQLNASVANLCKICAKIDSDCILLRRHKVMDNNGAHVAQYLIRKRAQQNDFEEVRVAVVGNVDAGKSTLLGVLTHQELDNGRGLARQRLFRHKHEMESGRTSSVGNDILGFDSCGNVVNKPDTHGGHLDWVKICEQSSKVITFIDLAGHERYLKTTIFGMTGHAPDYTMLMIGANAGIVGMTKEHLGLALALNVPVFVVITKIDMCPQNILQNTIKLLQRVLKSAGCRKIPVMVQSEDDVVIAATNFATERLCPIFQVSNVSGINLNLLKLFLNLLIPRSPNYDNDAAEFQIDDTYSVPGVGTVVSGLTLRGMVRLGDVLCLGPDSLGHFIPIAIKSIHRKRMPVKEVRSGQTASFSLKKMKRSDIRKGMVLVSPSLNPQAFWEFEAEILVLHHPTTISPRYQAMVHVASIRQTASILSMNRDCLRTGDKATVHFRFIKNPEYLHIGTRMVFREGRTKAIGNISKLLIGVPPQPSQQLSINKPKPKKMFRQSMIQSEFATNNNDNSQELQETQELQHKNHVKKTRTRHRGGTRHKNNYCNSETIASTSNSINGSV